MLFVCKLLLNSPPQPLLLTRPLPEDARSFACRGKHCQAPVGIRRYSPGRSGRSLSSTSIHVCWMAARRTDPTDWRRNRQTALRVSPLHLSCTCLRRPHPLQLQTQPPTCSSPASIKGTTHMRPIRRDRSPARGEFTPMKTHLATLQSPERCF